MRRPPSSGATIEAIPKMDDMPEMYLGLRSGVHQALQHGVGLNETAPIVGLDDITDDNHGERHQTATTNALNRTTSDLPEQR